MKILKFGGTSVANAPNIQQVKDIVGNKSESNVIVVVSAFSGITNHLQEIAENASKGAEYALILDTINSKHKQVIDSLFESPYNENVLNTVDQLLQKLIEVCKGVEYTGELTPQTNDLILSFGERISSFIISNYFEQEFGKATLLDPTEFIYTDNKFGFASVRFIKTNDAIRKNLTNFEGIGVCPGFIAKSKSGKISTLGRGGSDYTAAIIAGALNVELLEIYTDVNGMMTADPTLVKGAHVIRHLTYEEAMELSHFGAKVIYPPTIQPALSEKIPIRIRNTFEPGDPGTLISENGNGSDRIIKGLTSIRNITLVSLKGAGMVGIPNFSHRLFRALADNEINIILITQASSEHSITVGIKEENVTQACDAVDLEFELEISVGKVDPLDVKTGLSIIAVVGNNMHHQVGVSGKLFSTLAHNGVNVVAIAQGSSERNISAVIESRDLKKSLNSLHESFFLSDFKRLNLFIIGTGNVGSVLLDQIIAQNDYLKENHHLDIRVCGLANSRKMCFDTEGGLLEEWQSKLDSGDKMDVNSFINLMGEMNLRNSVFIDNTATTSIPDQYEKVLLKSISVVTPNKVACSSDLQHYQKLKQIARKYRSGFLFETNVGAGLPVISTLNDLVKSGDRVIEIQGVLSGSLNFIFNNYDGTRSFASIVRQAQKEGYTEPDPRLDLSGKDVMRKLLILAREAGFPLEEKDIKTIPCVPEKCMEKEGEAFFEILEQEEPYFQSLVDKTQGGNLKYVASFSEKGASTELQAISAGHPFYNLEGKDNIVLFYTNRYKEQPLVIKGAGAGAEVTASGIFADIIKIANS